MSTALAPGTLVAGRFRVEGVLGQGGMGVVYRAIQEPMGRAVALKLLRPELASDARSRARFEREAKIASTLAHPSAVAVFDFGEHRFGEQEASAYLAMELVVGESLRARIERGPLTTAAAIELGTQLADVLAAAAEAGLVHRDLKPENVIVEASGRARVLDFGLAFALATERGARMTREGVVVGTPEYLSPEQARGESVGPATDVYALGCVLHELITGRPPFTGGELDVLTRQMYAPPPPLRREAEVLDVPVELDALRRAMLDKRDHARPTAAEVRDRLALLDPDPARGRARARVDGYLGPRAMRMIDAAPAARSVDEAALEVAVSGTIDASLAVALAASGIAVHPLDEAEPDAAVILVPDATDEVVGRLARLGPPVVAGLGALVPARLAACLRAGAADVVGRPFVAADLARKLRRVAKDRARRGS